jgi:hypothetical protein
MTTRAEQLAEAYLEIARVNHYMVGIVDGAVTDDELSAAEQILIAGQNALTDASMPRTAARVLRYELALDVLQAEQRERTSAASQAEHDAACAADSAPYGLGDLNLDAMDADDLRATRRGLRAMADYAMWKGRAMRDRAAGRMWLAASAEETCERIRCNIPANWRW